MHSWEFVDYGEAKTKLRVDVRSAKYCEDKCEEVKSIASITADKVVFYDGSTGAEISGRYFDVDSNHLLTRSGREGDGGWMTSNDSMCKFEKFSGFPKIVADEKR